MRLLLIEDEIMLSEALVYILKKNNYNVDAAYDGIKGQEMAEIDIYDVIILDRMLPGRDGLDILKILEKGNSNSCNYINNHGFCEQQSRRPGSRGR